MNDKGLVICCFCLHNAGDRVSSEAYVSMHTRLLEKQGSLASCTDRTGLNLKHKGEAQISPSSGEMK